MHRSRTAWSAPDGNREIWTDRWDLAMMETDKLHMTRAAQQHTADFPDPESLAKQAIEGDIPHGEA